MISALLFGILFVVFTGITVWVAIIVSDWAASTLGPMALRIAIALAIILFFVGLEVAGLVAVAKALDVPVGSSCVCPETCKP